MNRAAGASSTRPPLLPTIKIKTPVALPIGAEIVLVLSAPVETRLHVMIAAAVIGAIGSRGAGWRWRR